MFGKRKEKQEELLRMRQLAQQDRGFFAHMKDQKAMFEATVSEMEESYRQLDAGTAQIKENLKEAAQMAADNGKKENSLTTQLAQYGEISVQAAEKKTQMLQSFAQMQEDLTGLVDENKHFTTPSKYLSTVSTALKADNEAAREELEQMRACGKQMGVLALNAAIEAGRMGEAGKEFVTAAEEIKTAAGVYEQVIGQAYERLEASDARIAELEEQVHRLVTLLKENNVSTNRLMKSGQEAMQCAQEWQQAEPQLHVRELENAIVVLRNADEEIAKSGDRDRMQLEDLTEEVNRQKEKHTELLQVLEAVYSYAADRLQQKESE